MRKQLNLIWLWGVLESASRAIAPEEWFVGARGEKQSSKASSFVGLSRTQKACVVLFFTWSLSFGQSKASPPAYLGKTQLSLHHREVLRALGNRLETPGAERLALSGTFTRSNGGSPVTSNANLILELPYRLRIDEQQSTGQQRTIFDGNTTWKSTGPVGKQESDLIDTFYNDSVEHFLQGQVQGFAVRPIGHRVQMVDTLNAGATFVCDVYQVAEQIQVRGQRQEQRRKYCFQSDSHLLRKVSYELRDGSQSTNVETWYENWRLVQGQMIPGIVARYENGAQVLLFTLDFAAVGGKAQDGVFDHPGGN